MSELDMRFGARKTGKVEVSPDKFVVLDHLQLRGQDYSGRDLRQFCTIGCRLEGCRFTNVRIEDAQIGAGHEPSEFVECTFDGAIMQHVSAGASRFVRCSFRNVELHNWLAFEVELIDCTFTGILRTAVFNGSVRKDKRGFLGREVNEIRGNDFSGMEFIDVGFRTGVDLSQQRLPSGADYLYVPDAAAALQRAKLELLGWSNLEARRAALHTVKCLERDVEAGQQQLLLRMSDEYLYLSPPKEAVDTLFALLRGKSVKLN